MADKDNSDIIPDFLSAGTIKGDRIVNAAGDELGKIEEIMIDLQDGRVAYAVLSFGGFLGMGDKLFAVPWQAFSLRPYERAFLLDIPRDVLENADGFYKDHWPITREELSRTYTYYGYQPYWQAEIAGQARKAGTFKEIPGERGTERISRTESTTSRENPDFLSADSLKGDKVVNRAGEDLGKIEELMIDLDNGKVAYTVLSFGGFLGIGNKLFAFPWQALSLRVHEHAFLLDIPKDVLKQAEGFDKRNWPATNREWLANLYRFYGYQPYWRPEMVENRPGNI
jgi:sporulation protein YlmC with PRC-barrel domain